MGLEDEIYVTEDIGLADALLATSSELKQNPWIRSVAKFQKLPVFVIKVTSQYSFLFGKTMSLFISLSVLFQILLICKWLLCLSHFQSDYVCLNMQSSNMSQLVKAIRMILDKFSVVAKSKQPIKSSSDIEIEDDAPKRKPSLEEIDALEVSSYSC